MAKVSIIGNFSSGRKALNGQTVKTRIVTDELIKVYGKKEVAVFDTSGGLKTLFYSPWIAIKALYSSRDVVIFPAHNALRVFVPLLVILQGLFPKRRVHYVVIGGWLPAFIQNRPLLRICLYRLYMIYAETHRMKHDLWKSGYTNNVTYMPNCKSLKITKEEDFPDKYAEPYKLCTFSRVWREKGIADAVNAVKSVNGFFGRVVYALDIYGTIECGDEQWFEELQSEFPEYIKYGGSVSFDKSMEVLNDYFALLFPTKYSGEGIPGTIIDAYAAGLPVISSLYPNFGEIIDEGKTGLGYDFGNVDALIALLKDIADKPEMVISLKRNCVRKALLFQPDKVVSPLVNNINV